MKTINIRKADQNDVQVLYDFIHALSRYEKREQDATLTKEALSYWLFEKKTAEALILTIDGIPAGYAIYYPVFASFAAEAHIHLEDMYLLPAYRHNGIGQYFLAAISSIVLKEGYTAMEWSCLEWNTPAAAFYQKAGAIQEQGRIHFDLNNQGMAKMKKLSDQCIRIIEMEAAMDRLTAFTQSDALPTAETYNDYAELSQYYDNEWKQDYEADERGEIPSFIKRGVLSQDGLYNLLDEADEKLH